MDYTADAISVTNFYTYEDKQIILIQSPKIFYSPSIDNEQTVKSLETIEGQEYMIYTSTNSPDINFIWDNGEYIFQLISNLDKEEGLNLCKSIKVKEN